MKKLMLLAVLLVTTIFVNAQRGGGDPEVRIQKRVDHLTQALDLNTEQQSQLKAIFTEQSQNRKANGQKMRDLSQEEREALKAERKTARAEFDQKISSILTPAQNETFQQLERENKGERGQRRGDNANKKKGENGNRGRGKGKGKGVGKAANTIEGRTQKRVDYLTEKLALDEGQQQAVYDLLINRTPKNKSKKRKDLSEEERAALKNNRKVEKAAIDAGLAEILTPNQLETYNNLPKRGKKKGKKNRNK